MRLRQLRRRASRHPVRWLLAGVAGALLLVVVGQQLWYLGWVCYYVDHNPQTTAFMSRRLAALRARDPGATIRYHWVPYERISPWLRRAVIAGEDQRFVSHHGFDWRAMRKALRENLEADEVVRGGSTITQQLAKNLFLSPRRTIPRKLQEAAITVMLEATMSKRRILELYLNVIEWGDRVFGAQAAAEHYYDIPAARLDAWQAAMLAARIPDPRYYDGRAATDYLHRRARWIHSWIGRVRTP